MTTVVAFVQRCMVVLAIFLCYFHVRSDDVNCELYPFHYNCRGMMSKKRAMLPNSLYGSGCDGSKGDVNCGRTLEERRYLSYVPLAKSRLLVALLDGDLRKDIAYNARHRQRYSSNDNNENNGLRRKPLMENFLSELEAKDNDY